MDEHQWLAESFEELRLDDYFLFRSALCWL
jgi:hypothetical protein